MFALRLQYVLLDARPRVYETDYSGEVASVSKT
jgi:hypothetical protein